MAKERKITFEQALARLEKIVDQIEEGKVPLEESIEKYAEGTNLVKQCREILASAERKIQLLAKSQGDKLAPAGELDQPDETQQASE